MICAVDILNVSVFALPKRFALKSNLGIGALKISECGLRIADFEWALVLIFQSAIRNLKSAINFTPRLGISTNFDVYKITFLLVIVPKTPLFAIGVAAGRFDD